MILLFSCNSSRSCEFVWEETQKKDQLLLQFHTWNRLKRMEILFNFLTEIHDKKFKINNKDQQRHIKFKIHNNTKLDLSNFIHKGASADHIKRSRNLSPFDAITPPKITMEFGRSWVAVPLDMTDDRRLRLIPFCKAALDKFNAENQDANFVFLDVVKTTWRPGGIYYITFQAQKDSPNCPATTFQAMVIKVGIAPLEIKSCSIKI